jgi:hypothetical protein
MRKIATIVCLIVSMTLFTLSARQTRRHAAHPSHTPEGPPPQVTTACDENIDTIEQCPKSGCGENGDALLNALKNAVPTATSGESRTIDDFINLPQPTRWNTGASRTFKDSDKEGTMVEMRAYILAVKPEGGESCNCELIGKNKTYTDVHIALVADAQEEHENNSITAEITPRVRHSGHPDWTYAKLKDLEGDYVKVVGQLMLDTKHIPQTSKLPGERTNKKLKRATNWEIHPITALWVCTKSKPACDHGSGWEAVP